MDTRYTTSHTTSRIDDRQSTTSPDDLLKPDEVARRIRVSPATLAVWRSSGRYRLPYTKIGTKVVYRRSDVEAWIEARTRVNGASA